ncbi:MAG: low temperature requirement protein [Ilumatobacteraceae bacterium]|nr:low temperature requirement protein [Ilumatobacteraceae bacterium]
MIAPVVRPMRSRDPNEEHRASTPLELLFDLCFVVAVSQAAAQLHAGLAGDHVRHSIIGYLSVFFAIWWAWLNFTWFASAYDTDDVPYRLLTLLQIAGVLVLASGVRAAFEGNFTTITVGYIVMRLALTAQWLRAAAQDPGGRRTPIRYVAALVVTQTGWILRLSLPASWGYASFVFLVLVEIAGPFWAERRDGMTSWHPEHIAERYGLFTIIVLGECILSAFVAIDTAIGSGGISARLMVIAGAGLVAMFGLWWTYFGLAADEMLRERPHLSWVWGYGHYFLFASIAAMGAGIALVAELAGHHDAQGGRSLSALGQALAISVPVAVALLLLALMRPLLHGSHHSSDLVSYGSAALVITAGALAGEIGLVSSLCLVAAIVVAKVATDIAWPRTSALVTLS